MTQPDVTKHVQTVAGALEELTAAFRRLGEGIASAVIPALQTLSKHLPHSSEGPHA